MTLEDSFHLGTDATLQNRLLPNPVRVFTIGIGVRAPIVAFSGGLFADPAIALAAILLVIFVRNGPILSGNKSKPGTSISGMNHDAVIANGNRLNFVVVFLLFCFCSDVLQLGIFESLYGAWGKEPVLQSRPTLVIWEFLA